VSNETPQSPQEPEDATASSEPEENLTSTPGAESDVEAEPVRIEEIPVDVGEPEPAVESPGASDDAVTESEDGLDRDTTEYDDVVAVDYEEVRFDDQPAPAAFDTAPTTAQTDAYPPADAFLAGTAAGGAAATGTAAGGASDTAAATPAAPTPVYVTAPTPPKPRGNRLMGILIAVVAAVAYAVVFAAVALGIFALREVRGPVTLWESYLQTAGFWVPVVVFFLAFVLLIVIVNRGGWWAYGLGSFFVGVIVCFGYLGGALITVSAWNLNSGQVGQFIGTLWANPLTFAAAVVGLEASLWFGAWVAARGRRVRARNVEAQRDYDRRVEAGPTA